MFKANDLTGKAHLQHFTKSFLFGQALREDVQGTNDGAIASLQFTAFRNHAKFSILQQIPKAKRVCDSICSRAQKVVRAL